MAKKVTQKEKEKMWRLYQKHKSYKKVAEKMRRNPATVSRYVHEYEVAIGVASILTNQT
ncbi:MAG: helix-turn-helix domain-containing protein [Peptococcaceae bacterium]|nr:helix-turn-helix domain-containing protein [Peptococcaceae bacterium]